MSKPDHERIWLEPRTEASELSGRMWCQDKVWPEDWDDGEPTEYVRADIADTLRAEVARLEAENAEMKACSASDLLAASEFSIAAAATIQAYEADLGEPLPDDYEIGRIEDSRGSPSFRIRVGHIRRLAAAIAKAERPA